MQLGTIIFWMYEILKLSTACFRNFFHTQYVPYEAIENIYVVVAAVAA